MFSMIEIGKRIAKLRKEKNLTQVELADALGITYQAVSNWERGDSMPDISKLSELSLVLDVSIDVLLGNQSHAKVVKDILDDQKIETKSVDQDVLEDILPMVKPQQFKENFDNSDISFEQIVLLAPYLDEDVIDTLVLESYQTGSPKKIITLAPFMSEAAVGLVFQKELNAGTKLDHDLVGLAPFLDKEQVNEIGKQIYSQEGARYLVAIAPFMSSEIINDIVNEEIKKGNIKKIHYLLPFADSDRFGEILKDSFKKHFHKTE